MRLLAWNMGHQTREVPISPKLLPALLRLQPDMVLLNEFVDGPSRTSLREGLFAIGLEFTAVSTRVDRHNQVFIASRWPLSPGRLHGPDVAGGAGRSNFLHVLVPGKDFEVVGIRAPMYKTTSETAEYWQKLKPIVQGTRESSIVWIGDLNSDPDLPRKRGGATLRELESEGWQIPRPTGPWSFYKGTKIDFALISESVEVRSAEYVIEIGDETLASGDRSTAVSDHAALVVEVSVRHGAAA